MKNKLKAISLIIALLVAIATLSGCEKDPPRPSPSPSPTSPSQSPTAGYNITGKYFYLNGKENDDSLWFYSDGTMEIYYALRGETDTRDYSVRGDTISVTGSVYGDNDYTLTIRDDYTLVDKYQDVYSAPSVNARQQPSSGHDITGHYFYLDGMTHLDSLWFYSDGTMEIYYYATGETDTYDYGVDNGQITVFGRLYGTESPYVFAIVDEYTLIDKFNDFYIRADNPHIAFPDPSPEPTQDAGWRPNPNAPLDARASVDRLALGMLYPSSQYFHTLTDWGFQLRALDPEFSVIFVDILLHSPGETTNNVRERIFGDYYSQLSDVDVHFNDHLDDRGYGMFEMTGDNDGTETYICGIIAAWRNERTGVSDYYGVVLICPAEFSDDYYSLFWRVFESRHDT